MEPMIGEIRMFAGTFAPRGWAFCEGQLLSISANNALFSILGTTYGGDGRTSFGLPDLRGRVPVQQGHGPGLSNITLGQKYGTYSNTLTTNQLANHNHPATLTGAVQASISTEEGDVTTPVGNYPASTEEVYYSDTTDNSFAGPLDTSSMVPITGNTGGSQPVNNYSPLLAVYYIIALVGIYPSRS